MMCAYDEPPEAVSRCVRELNALGATHIVMVDGAYALYPGGLPMSSPDMREALFDAVAEVGIGSIYYAPESVWHGNEVEKRQTLLQIAQSITTDDDFLIPWDCDFNLYEQQDLCAFLEENGRDFDFADVQLTDCAEDLGWYWVRLLLRARRDLHFGPTNHYTYFYGEGCGYTWPDGTDRYMTVVAPRGVDLDIGLKTSVRVKHRRMQERSEERWQRQVDYYSRRDTLGVER